MKLIRAATLTVASLERAIGNYTRYFDYRVAEEGFVATELASSWNTPNSTGRAYAVLQPDSGANVYIRFIEQPPVAGYLPLRSYGWNAIEICVQNVLEVNQRMKDSPFEIIGPPNKIPGLDAIHPMQVKGPDNEIIYLTEINDDLPEYNLPRAESLIDKLFILVAGCSDRKKTAVWMEQKCGLSFGRDMSIPYTMLAKAYGKPLDELYDICTLVHEKDVFLELDQYPALATKREQHLGSLPPGCAIGTFWHPNIDSLEGPWLCEPRVVDGVIYNGKRVGVLVDPDDALVEIVED